jgi:hypothetical protein
LPPARTFATGRSTRRARRGQGLFTQRVRQVEVQCRIAGVDRIEHLRSGRLRRYWNVGTSGFWS